MSPRNNSSRSLPAPSPRARHRHARKRSRSRLPLLAVTAAAAGLGAVGASVGSAPWANAISSVALDAHVTQASTTGRSATSDVASVLGLQLHGQVASAAQPQHVQLDSRVTPVPGIVGTLTPGAGTDLGAEWSPGAVTLTPHSAVVDVPEAQTHAAAAHVLHVLAASAHAAPAHAAPAQTAPAQTAPRKPVQADATTAHVAPAHRAAPAPVHAAPARRVQVRPAQTTPFEIYDSVTPSSIPAGYQVATYANGDYAASSASVAGRGNVLWIDTNGSDPSANALDVEPGDATPSGAAAWIQTKLDADHNSVAIIYTMLSDWQAVKDNVAGLPQWMQSQVRYWIADPTGVPHMVPGSNATQWYWGNNYDISTADPGFES